MVARAEDAVSLSAGMDRAAFLADRRTQLAGLNLVQTVGEASHGVPESIKSRLPAVPWRSIHRMPDRLAHHHFAGDREIVWTTVSDDLPVLIPQLPTLLDERPEAG